ncbi:hypothetical protein J4N42_17020 [Vibrio sp. SCSIO 43135]|uniref:Glycine zipper domain-containing protein n=1 Tax=Vibrio paucivorans TaxID=2829489 RepID=A0A9X3HRC3_9VIBR|nr:MULTISPECIES: hypothetical protein [Vibrio]MCW8334045.1 hypothetical protein [Vibrio paucivorans]USD43857.1 hypothetical protein J4N42_17020 [Vibrio sp. SCSIO 43135]
MKLFTKSSLVAALSLPLLAGCVTPGEDDPNALTKQGAAGGALLGLTLGALTGDAELAMKGAVAGGVAGGVAGAGADIQNNRENMRGSSRDEAIANIGNNNQNAATNQKQTWDELNNFVGEWNVSIRSHSGDLKDAHPISGEGKLATTSQANVDLSNDQGVNISAQFSYSQDQGYQLDLVNNAKDVKVNFAGEFQPQANRYQFYPTNINDVIYQDIPSADIRVELGFAGSNVWIIDTYAYIDGAEKKLQTFRFNRAG